MQGTGKGMEGTHIKGRHGRTRIDCPKSEKKKRKLKVRDALFSELMGFSEDWRAPLCSVELGGHSRVFQTEKKITFENEYAGTGQITK